MIDCRILCSILYITLSLVVASGRLVIRDIPNVVSPQETPDSLFNLRQLSDQSVDVKNAVATATMHGSTSLGYYFTTLHFGTPSQPQTLIVDTGSTITTIPCNECGSNCGTSHFSEFFDPDDSTSFTELKCHEPVGKYTCDHCQQKCDFSISYSEGSSYRGQYKQDFVSFKKYTGDQRFLSESLDEGIRLFIPFGCTMKETNLFLTQEADGIFGLGVTTNSYAHPPNIVDALKLTDDSFSNAFSICAGQQGGYLAVGGFNTTYHAPTEVPQYVPYDGSAGQYRVHWNNIKFDGQMLDLSTDTLNYGRGAYIDSGTTMLYTTREISNKMNEAIVNHCSASEKNCGGNLRTENCWYHDSSKYPTINDFFATFATFTFDFGHMQSAVYEWKPEDYLFRYSEDQDYYCTGIDAVGGTRTILGGTFMKNHDILFDKDNSRIGFIRSSCSSGYSLTTYPKSRIGAHHVPFEEEINYIPTIIFYGALIILIMTIFSIILSRCKNGSDEKDPDMEFEPSLPERKTAATYEPVSHQEFTLLKENDKAYQEIPEEFSI